MGKSKRLRAQRKANKPDFWIQVVHSDESRTNIPFYGDRNQANYKAFAICRWFRPPVDMVLIMAGTANPDNPGPDDILTDLRPYPFVAAGEAAQFAG